MRHIPLRTVLMLGLISTTLIGCSTQMTARQQNNTTIGAGAGALIGGVLGNIIGDDGKHTLTGAAIGGAVGAAVGHGWDQKKAGMGQ